MSTTGVSQLVASTATNYGVSPSLALAVAQQESGLNQAAVSKAGAIGVMQLMPGTAAGLNVNPYDVTQNVQGGVSYLSQQLATFPDQAQAVAAYNAGPGAVTKAINKATAAGDPDAWLTYLPTETQNYVSRILGPDYSAPSVSSSVAVSSADPLGLDSLTTSVDIPDLTSVSIDGGTLDASSINPLVIAGGALIFLLLIR